MRYIDEIMNALNAQNDEVKEEVRKIMENVFVNAPDEKFYKELDRRYGLTEFHIHSPEFLRQT